MVFLLAFLFCFWALFGSLFRGPDPKPLFYPGWSRGLMLEEAWGRIRRHPEDYRLYCRTCPDHILDFN